MDEIKEIISFIPFGHENGIGRNELRIMTGLSDRKTRKMIEDESTEEHPILNLQDGRGYFRPTSKDELLTKIYRNQEHKRAVSILQKVSKIDRYLNGKTEVERNQLSLFDCTLDTIKNC